MNIALLSGAFGNSGDSLIEYRSKRLLESIFPNDSVHVFSRKQLNERFEEIDSHELIVFSGGPIYQQDISRNFDVKKACILSKPIKIVGGGWKGAGRSLSLPYKYTFSNNTYEFFKKVDSMGGLACRDWYSVKALRNSGLSSARMTGCPAWYDIELVHQTVINDDSNGKMTICVSDPASPSNWEYVIPLLSHIKNIYPDAVIKFVFHRGKNTPDYDVRKNAIIKQGIADTVDMAPDFDSFKIYDNCSLHIGFRVHAHIYNLSKRHRTILIEEDGRGAGVNEALGLPSLLAYDDEIQISNSKIRKLSNRLMSNKNGFLLKQLDEYLDMLERTGNVYFENAYRLMEKYYCEMLDFLRN